MERLRSFTRPPPKKEEDLRNEHLKKLSEERVKNWPNTLAAQRKKKEQWKEIRAAEEEAYRVKVDNEERELREAAAAKAYAKAKYLKFENQDKTKFLRAQQLYSDCVYERQEQIREKEVMKLWEKEKEKAYHEDVMRHVAEGDRREAAELEARKLKNAPPGTSMAHQVGTWSKASTSAAPCSTSCGVVAAARRRLRRACASSARPSSAAMATIGQMVEATSEE